jgi:23S rRNA (adenine-N6)-dimethyltransferase
MKKQNKRNRKIRKYIEWPNFSGQHLLHNKRIINDLIQMANLTSNDTVLDLGAGKGALTFPVAEKAGKVIAVEYDPRFVEILKKKAEAYPNIKVIQQDILKLHLPKEPFIVVAGIPYAITTPIMKMLLHQPANSLQRAVLVMEKGAAKRFTSYPITNPLILKWRMWFDLGYVREISRENFSPPPKVDSAILIIRRKKKPSIPYKYHDSFLGLAEYALKYPQLPLYEALKGVFTPPQITRLVRNLGVNRNIAICLLNEIQWGIVFHTMVQYVQRPYWPKAKKHKNN